MTDNIMDDVRTAAASVSSTETSPLAPETPTSAPETRDSRPLEAPPVEETPASPARGRDESGRFAPKPKDTPGKSTSAPTTPVSAAPTGQTGPEASPAEAAPAAPAHRPPQSWKPGVREHWTKLPPDVQAEVARIDREHQRYMQEAAGARKVAEGFERMVAPYRALLTGEPLQVVGSLLQTAAQLQTAPPKHKAALVAQMVTGYGISVEDLAEALEGKGPQPSQQAPEYRDPRLDQLLQRLEQAQQQRAQTLQQKHSQTIEDFAASHEFFDDVRDEMADLIDVASRRGVVLSLEDAYNRALSYHPEVSKVVQQRKQHADATAQNAQAQRARAASSSVRTEPAPAVAAPKGNGSIMDDVRAAAALHRSR